MNIFTILTNYRTGHHVIFTRLVKCQHVTKWRLRSHSEPGGRCSNSQPRHIVITLRPRQNGRHFPDDIFKCISLNENVWISIKISLNFVPRGPINNIPALVQIMAWRRPGDKPLSEPMMVCLLTHICVTRPQWVMSHIMTCTHLHTSKSNCNKSPRGQNYFTKRGR